MVVIVIVGVLAMIALPAYRQYTQKANFSEVILSTAAIKKVIEICAQTTGSMQSCRQGSFPGIGLAVGGAANVRSQRVHRVAVVPVSNSAVRIEVHAGGAANVDPASRATYKVLGTLNTNGQVSWALDAANSNCDERGLC